MKMIIGVMKKGDRVLGVTTDFIAIERKNGEVDVIPFIMDNMGLRVDTENIVTIGYGNNTVQTIADEVIVTTF